MTDCQALANYVQTVADHLQNSKGVSVQLQMKAALQLLTPSQFPMGALYVISGGAVSGYVGYKALNQGNIPSGFSASYQDQIPNADQAHHFAAFFQLGFALGANVASAAASWWEKLERTPGNAGDIRLGQAAAQMGAYVRSGVLPVGWLAQTIKSSLCK